MTSIDQRFDLTPRELFEVIVDPRTYPDWLPGAKDVRTVSSDWPKPGSSFHHVVGFGPIALPDRTSVVMVTPPSQLVLLVRARPLIQAKVTFDIVADGSGSVLTLTEDPVGMFKLVSPISQPLIRARNARALHRLHEFVQEQ